jgi:hypothetical protein
MKGILLTVDEIFLYNKLRLTKLELLEIIAEL